MTEKKVLKAVKKHVKRVYKTRKSEDTFRDHILRVVDYSLELAKETDADSEVVELASWLHDIEKVNGNARSHHINGSKETSRLLKKFGYDSKKTSRVSQCVLRHSCDDNYPIRTIEDKVVAASDAISKMDMFLEEFIETYQRTGSLVKTKRALQIKYQKLWRKIQIPYAQELAQRKYDAIRVVLGEV